MNNVTPEHLVTVTQGATPVQMVILGLLGIIALGVIIAVVKWVVDLKVGTLPNDLAAIRAELTDLKLQLSDLRGELWSKEQVDIRISAAIRDHIEQCPYHHQ